MVTIAYLADHPDTIPTLANWFRSQWPDYYAQQTQADTEQAFRSEALRDGLPLRLVAFHSDELVGTVVLRERGSETLPEFRPELGGLYVVASHRGRGVATELIRVAMNIARDQEYELIYATTAVAGGILERLGWKHLQSLLQRGEMLALYRCELNVGSPTPRAAER